MERQSSAFKISGLDNPVDKNDRYDLLLASAGFESRCTFVSSKLTNRAVRCAASTFATRRALSFDRNVAWFSSAGFSVDDVADDEFDVWLGSQVEPLFDEEYGDGPLKLCVDISSMSRFRIASVVQYLQSVQTDRVLQIDFMYAPAHFSKRSEEAPIVVAGPVTASFAGWSSEPERPVMVILGLGYEPDKAMGALEYLDPASVWAFRPQGDDPRYFPEVLKANKTLWEMLPEERVVDYRVSRPFACLTSLESLTYGLLAFGRPVLVPFGPKLFTLCCLLCASLHVPEVSVWRVSSDQLETPMDRKPNGSIYGLRALTLGRSVNGTSETVEVSTDETLHLH